MATETEKQITRKAMAYGLMAALDEKPEKETYTAAEVKLLIRSIVDAENQE